jgi:cellulose biosynthesis protein BcsQ
MTTQKIWLVCSQKGGVSKSVIAYALAERLGLDGKKTALCNTDFGQYSAQTIAQMRQHMKLGPLSFHLYGCKERAEVNRKSRGFDNVVIDGGPSATQDTYYFAQEADVILIPTRTPILDLTPNVNLARSLEARGIPRTKICFVITQSPSRAQTESARLTLVNQGWAVLESDLHFATSYGTAGDIGRSIADVKHPGLKYKAWKLVTEISQL